MATRESTNVSDMAARRLSKQNFDQINHIARALYLAYPGEFLGETYDFSKALTPLAKRCWDAAVIAFDNEKDCLGDLEALLFDGMPA